MLNLRAIYGISTASVFRPSGFQGIALDYVHGPLAGTEEVGGDQAKCLILGSAHDLTARIGSDPERIRQTTAKHLSTKPSY